MRTTSKITVTDGAGIYCRPGKGVVNTKVIPVLPPRVPVNEIERF